MKEFFSKKVFSMTFTNLLFLTIGLMLAIGASVAYATWNDAKTTANPGQLSEANWNALVDQLQTSIADRVDNGYSATYMSSASDINGAYDTYACVATDCLAGWTNIGDVACLVRDFCNFSCVGPAIGTCSCHICALAR